MKKMFLIGTALTVLISNNCFAETRSTEKEIAKAVKATVATFRDRGMAGLTGMTEDCYASLKGKQFYCLYLDVASRHIDIMFVYAMNYPPTAFFSQDQFEQRVVPVLMRAKMNSEQGNGYMEMLTKVIGGAVEKEMTK
jgi:hypothetical protein